MERDIHHSTPLKGRNPVWIGRVDYSVEIQDAKSGTTEVQFSASEVISVAEMRGKIGRDVWKPMNVFDDDEQNIDDAVSIDEPERIASHSSLFVVPTTAMNSELSPLVGMCYCIQLFRPLKRFSSFLLSNARGRYCVSEPSEWCSRMGRRRNI